MLKVSILFVSFVRGLAIPRARIQGIESDSASGAGQDVAAVGLRLWREGRSCFAVGPDSAPVPAQSRNEHDVHSDDVSCLTSPSRVRRLTVEV